MKLLTADPRSLRINPANPRRTEASPAADAMLAASIAAIGLIQPPVVYPSGDGLVILAGHRRVAAAIAVNLAEIHVLVTEGAGDSDEMRSLSENIVRAALNPVDQWRAVERLLAQNWTEAAIATALALPVRNVQKLSLLGRLHPPTLDSMAAGDMPPEHVLRTIAAATLDEQAAAWKKHKPRKGAAVIWPELARALSKRRMMASDAKFGDELARAYGIVWQDDLFTPADEDGRHTNDVEAFFGAQLEWLRGNLPPNGVLLETDGYAQPKLPKGAERLWSKPTKNDSTGWCLDPRSGRVESIPFHVPQSAARRRAASGRDSGASQEARPRPPITQKGEALLGQIRTEALHEALAARPIEDHTLLALLILGYAAANVTVSSGARRSSPHGFCGTSEIASQLFADGILSEDLEVLQKAGRQMLIEILSCQEDRTNSGIVSRLAGEIVGADLCLPSLATAEFLGTLSRQVIEAAAVEHGITPKPRLKDTREALVGKFASGGSLFLTLAGFAPDPKQREAFTSRKRSVVETAGSANLAGVDEDEPPFDLDGDTITADQAGSADLDQAA